MSEESTKKVTIRKPTGKSTDVVVEQRIAEVEALLLQGNTRTKILRYSQKWNVHEDTVDIYIRRARDNILEIMKPAREENASLIIENMWKLANDPETSIKDRAAIMMNIAKIQGLDQQTVHHKIDVGALAEISDEELNKALDD